MHLLTPTDFAMMKMLQCSAMALTMQLANNSRHFALSLELILKLSESKLKLPLQASVVPLVWIRAYLSMEYPTTLKLGRYEDDSAFARDLSTPRDSFGMSEE